MKTSGCKHCYCRYEEQTRDQRNVPSHCDPPSRSSTSQPHCTTKVTVAEWFVPPPLPVTVRVYVPFGAFRFGDIVRVEVPEPATDVGLNEELVREGNPLTLKLTGEVNGPNGVIVTPYVVLEFGVTV